jgi:pimeloyl-ACP methyl ester carboxylesterase
MNVRTVTSKDGTSIAYEVQGSGPPVILVGGAFVDRSENAPLAGELADGFTVFNHDRRGRGESGDTPPYAVEREFEDLDAVIAEAGGSAHMYGISSGGALALEAAAAGVPIERLARTRSPTTWPRTAGSASGSTPSGSTRSWPRVATATPPSSSCARPGRPWR